jgi:23S rRNA (cytosine1962-C5)-methyltransferase
VLPVLQLKPGREKSVVNRHPWIFSGGLKNKPRAEEGDIVEVRSADNKVLGYGFYSEKSQISCRMFDWSNTASDFESADYWAGKIQRAYSLRTSLVISDQTNTFRLIHAEGDFLPGVIIDIYKDIAVAQLLIKGTERRKELILEGLSRIGYKKVYAKTKSSSQNIEDIETSAGWLQGQDNEVVTVKEHGLQFEVNFVKGQKTGFFIDQRENRLMVQQLAKGKRILNAFSYTGGFSVYALAGGAREVHSLDISADAVAMAERNAQINFPDASHKGITRDCFEFLTELEQDYYDFIILDPPAFAKTARAVENASRGYKQINMKAIKKIKSGGFLATFSCSQNIDKELFQKIVFGAAADAGRNVRIIRQLHQPEDHPVNIFHPEGEYLKGLLLYVE